MPGRGENLHGNSRVASIHPTVAWPVAALLLIGTITTQWSGRTLQAAEPAAVAAPVVDYSSELPRIEAVEPEAAIATMRVRPGYRLELAAAEPLLASPVAVSWDERGRLYVAEMRGYSELRDEGLSRIRLLTDVDYDGRYDYASIFVDGLLWPTAVTCWQGGVFVTDAPDLWYFKDTDGDGHADVRDKVLTGFGVSNVQGLVNSLQWTLDNRIHGSSSTNGGDLSWIDPVTGLPRTNAAPLSVRYRDFSFDPRIRDLRSETGGGQHGMSFDDAGRKFVCSNSNHAQQVLIEDRYLARNPQFGGAIPRENIAVDGPQAEVYRVSPVEPWRTLRTRLRVQGSAPGMVEGGGRAAGYFTGATGITVVRGSLFAQTDPHEIVVGDVGGNLVHRKRLATDGVVFQASRIDEECELVASTDTWFRPAQFANGPDGAFYIVDVYREVIEHPASLPPDIKRHLDLNSGRDRGRLWRLIPSNRQREQIPAWDQLSPAALVGYLAHPNAWHRETASRLIVERGDSQLIAPLVHLLASPAEADHRGRLHALYALTSLGQLTPELLLPRIDDISPVVREHAIRVAEPWLRGHSALRQAIAKHTSDSSAFVRQQLAWSLVEFPAAERAPLLAELWTQAAEDPAQQSACLLSAADSAPSMLIQLIASAASSRSQGIRPGDAGIADALGSGLPLVAVEAGRRIAPTDLTQLIGPLAELSKVQPAAAWSILQSLQTGLAGRGLTVSDGQSPDNAAALRSIDERGLVAVRATITDPAQSEAARVAAIRSLVGRPFDEVRSLLLGLLAVTEPRNVQLASLQVLNQSSDPGIGSALVATWGTLTPAIREQAVPLLLARPDRVVALLDAIAAGQIAPTELQPSQSKSLKEHRDEALRSRAIAVLPETLRSSRQAVVDAYRSSLELAGDLERGRAVFRKACAVCHRVEGHGYPIGPNLAAMKSRGTEAILVNILDPNREVNPQYVTYALVTTDGRTATGMISSETATSITLLRSENQSDTVRRSDIEELKNNGISLMPEGLEKQLDTQSLADLLHYLMQAP